MTATLAAPPAAPPRGVGRVPAFRLLWFGEGVSVLGTATSSILVPLLAVVGLHAGAWQVGLLTSAAWLPWVVVGLPAGALVDRLPPRAVMIAADLVSAGSLLSVPVAAALHEFTIGQLFAVALINGTATVFFRAAYPTLLRRVVTPDQLGDANARMFGTESAAQVAGPGVGGWLAGAVGSATGLLTDAVSFLVSAGCLWRLRLAPRPTALDPDEPERLLGRIRDGLRLVYGDPLLRYFTVRGGLSNFGLTGVDAILVLFLVRTVGLAPSRIGLLLAAGSAGGVLGASYAARLAKRMGSARALIVLQGAAAVSSPLVVLAGPGARSAVIPVCMAALSAGVVGGNVIRGAWRMRYVPERLQARAVTATQLVNFGTMPLAGLVAGWLGESIGLRATVLAMALVHTVATASIAWGPLRRLRDLPLPA